jgi:DNA mismatch repair protein MutH
MKLKEIYDRLIAHANITHPCPKTINKGVAGFLVETLAGISQTSNCLDCEDGEVKCFPLKRLKDGSLVPKETIAVTMIQPAALTTTPWTSSNAYKKLANCLYIPYERETPATIRLYTPYIFAISEGSPVFTQLAADYTAIVDVYRTTGSLESSSHLGKYLQNRTKGAGHGSTSRAFYLRPAFIKEFILPAM